MTSLFAVDFLNKREYLAGRECLRKAANMRAGVVGAEPSAAAKDRMRTGSEIPKLIRQLYPEGKLVESAGRSDEELAEITLDLLKSDVPSILDGRFIFEGSLAKIDVLFRSEHGWEIVKAKSANSSKSKHFDELAFQSFVVEGRGVSIARIWLALVNSEYVLDREFEPGKFFKFEDVTNKVRSKIQKVREEILHFQSELDRGPSVEPGVHCGSPSQQCEFFDVCGPKITRDSTFWLPGLKNRKEFVAKHGLGSAANVAIEDPDSPLTARALAAIRKGGLAVTGKPWDELKELPYPLHFVDFETASGAVPHYQGTRPYQVICTQWSNHILDRPGGELRHEYFLAQGDEIPDEEFGRALLQSVRTAGTILTYTEFENQKVKALPLKFEGRDELIEIFEQRSFDLFKLVKTSIYHPDFCGSFSLKAVLPALAPDATYEDLAIQEGGAAVIAYWEMVKSTGERREKLRQELMDYCERDTEAMVWLFSQITGLGPGDKEPTLFD